MHGRRKVKKIGPANESNNEVGGCGGGGCWRGLHPLPLSKGVWGSAVSSPIGVWGGAPEALQVVHY